MLGMDAALVGGSDGRISSYQQAHEHEMGRAPVLDEALHVRGRAGATIKHIPNTRARFGGDHRGIFVLKDLLPRHLDLALCS